MYIITGNSIVSMVHFVTRGSSFLLHDAIVSGAVYSHVIVIEYLPTGNFKEIGRHRKCCIYSSRDD